MGVGALVGGLLGMAAGASGVLIAGFTAGTMWAAGAALGSLFDRADTGFRAQSPTYAFGPIQNTKTQKLPVPLVYGYNRLAGNIIMQRFHDDKKTKQDMIVALGLGEFESIYDVRVNEIPLYTDEEIEEEDAENPEGCSLSIYRGTVTQPADPRSLGSKSYPNIAHIDLTLKASEKISGAPTVTSLVKGRKVWMPEEFIPDVGTTEEEIVNKIVDIISKIGAVGITSLIVNPALAIFMIFNDVINSIYNNPPGIAFTTNPAWIVYDILTATYYDPETGKDEPVGLGLPKEFIDLESFKEAATYCDELIDGESRFTVDYTIDTEKRAVDHLADILSCFRGSLVAREKIALYIDKPVSAPYKAVGLDNIIEGGFTWWQRPDDEIYNRVVIEWTDPSQHWEQVVSVFEDEEDIAERGVIERRYSLLGITRLAQAGRMGAYLIDIAKGSRNACQFALSIKDSDIEAGDVIAITHDLPGWENKWFRVVKVDDYDDDTIAVTASEYVANAYNDVALDVSYTIDTNLPTPFEVLPPQNLSVKEWGYKTKSGIHIANLDITWTPPPVWTARVDSYRVEMLEGSVVKYIDTIKAEETGTMKYTITSVPITTLTIRVTTKSVYGDWSEPAEREIMVIGIDVPPPPPVKITTMSKGSSIVVSGVLPDIPDIKELECRIGGTSWQSANFVGRYSSFPFEFSGVLDGTTIVWVKIIDNANQSSEIAASSVATVQGINETFNIILERDDIESETGTLTNLIRRADGVLVADIEADYYEFLSPVIDTNKIGKTTLRFDFSYEANFSTLTYGEIINRTYGEYPSAIYSATHVDVIQEIEVRFSNDNVNWTDWEIYIHGDKIFRYIQYKYRLTPTGTPYSLMITKLHQIYDVPDIAIIDIVHVPEGGKTINFMADYGKEFYYVPKEITPIVRDSRGEVFPYVDNVSETGLTITCYNKEGESVAHDVQITIKGY